MAYLRSMHQNRKIEVSLVASKTRVAPIKRQSIPRLELLGATIFARLVNSLQRAPSPLSITLECFYWTDSYTVLCWVRNNKSRKPYVQHRVNKQLGVLKRTCYSLTDINIRRTLFLSLVKSKLSYASQIWSPTHNRQLSERIEQVQRRATKWILRTRSCEMSYKQRLLKLELLPLSYNREIKDLVFFFKSILTLTIASPLFNMDVLDLAKPVV